MNIESYNKYKKYIQLKKYKKNIRNLYRVRLNILELLKWNIVESSSMLEF